jgi:hypothetical protein
LKFLAANAGKDVNCQIKGLWIRNMRPRKNEGRLVSVFKAVENKMGR